jgi:hypothetical protein
VLSRPTRAGGSAQAAAAEAASPAMARMSIAIL